MLGVAILMERARRRLSESCLPGLIFDPIGGFRDPRCAHPALALGSRRSRRAEVSP